MSIKSILLLLWLPLLTAAQFDNAEGCSCFHTNGSSAAYFLYHRFWDYRNVDPSSISNPVPSVLTNATATTSAQATNDFFAADTFTKDWNIQSWNNSDSFGTDASDAAVLMVNSANNVYIEQSTDDSPDYTTFLTLRTARQSDFQSAAELDSTEQNFMHLSARFLARVVGSPGACAGLFTYLSPTDPNDAQTVQEADIEILTSGERNVVHYTNQPSNSANGDELPEATSVAANPGDIDWTKWQVYRLDWTPGMTSWYVNGISVANISFQAPRDPSGLILNMWGDGGSWTGNMNVSDEAYLQLQWVEVVYNTSGAYTGSEGGDGIRSRDEMGASGKLEKRKKHTPGCKVVCSVDEEVNITGTPALLYNNTGAAIVLSVPGVSQFTILMLPIILAGFTFFGLI
ncbi:xylanase 3 [Phlyctema vagabunda]|uniref:Xylanase 3 n=1 Tax=Phlyctema vagabunda TaxID=108571 RepID=A0ABR4PKZ4_9HELO